MVALNLSKDVKIDRVKNAVAAGTSAQTSDSVDMQNYEGVLFMVILGPVVDGTTGFVKAQQSADDTTFDDLAGTKVAFADDDDNKIIYLDVFRPSDRYVRVSVDRSTQNVTIDGIVAIQYGARKLPVTHAAEVRGETHVSPAEGTA